jgi:sulfatase maturation enzyme AslB (radical SAM superfamily)
MINFNPSKITKIKEAFLNRVNIKSNFFDSKFLKTVNESKGSVYIYGFGIAGRWLSNLIGERVKGFIDSDHKKKAMAYHGISVITEIDAIHQLQPNDLIIISIVDVQDVLDVIKRFPTQNWLALGQHLVFGSTILNFDLPEEASFIEYSLKAVEKCHKGILDSPKLFFRSIDMVITEKCSMKCKDCSNLMQYYEKAQDVSFDKIFTDFEMLIDKSEHIFEVRLIGGEPFMNKDIYLIIEKVLKFEKISKLVIYTNFTIPIKEEFIESFRNEKIILSITDYGDLSRNKEKNMALVRKYGIIHRIHEPEYWTDSGRIKDFDRTTKENEDLFEKCCGKNLLTISNGRLYRCPFAANADRLKAIPFDEQNFVSLSASEQEISKYTREIKSIPACGHCNGRSFDGIEIEAAVQTRKPLPYIVRQ